MNLDDHLCGWTPVAHYHWVMTFLKRIIYGRRYSKPSDKFFQDGVLERLWQNDANEVFFGNIDKSKYADVPSVPRELHGFLPLNANATVTTTKPEDMLIYGNAKSAKEPRVAREITDDTKKVGCGGYFALNTDILIDFISAKQTMQKFEHKLMVNTGEKWEEY
jgi:hypothetical protein